MTHLPDWKMPDLKPPGLCRNTSYAVCGPLIARCGARMASWRRVSPPRWIANLHLAVNLGAVVIFANNLWLRFHLPTERNLPLGLSVVGVVALAFGIWHLAFGDWLGGEMVYVKGMAVEAVKKLAKKVEKPSVNRAA